jgi:hypothetical protein
VKPFTTIAIALIGLFALVQLGRFLLGWEVIVNGVAVPLWASAVAAAVVGVIAVMAWRETRR